MTGDLPPANPAVSISPAAKPHEVAAILAVLTAAGKDGPVVSVARSEWATSLRPTGPRALALSGWRGPYLHQIH